VTKWLKYGALVLLLAMIVVAFVVPRMAVFATSYGIGPPPMLFYPRASLVDEGVAMILVCGEQPKAETVNQTARAPLKYAYRGGGWWSERGRPGSSCVVYYQHSRWGGD
jgi:hypothetical protein